MYKSVYYNIIRRSRLKLNNVNSVIVLKSYKGTHRVICGYSRVIDVFTGFGNLTMLNGTWIIGFEMFYDFLQMLKEASRSDVNLNKKKLNLVYLKKCSYYTKNILSLIMIFSFNILFYFIWSLRNGICLPCHKRS